MINEQSPKEVPIAIGTRDSQSGPEAGYQISFPTS